MAKSSAIRIYNCSGQMIPIQARVPNADFYSGEQQIRIQAGKDILLPKSHIMMDQIDNLRARGMIKVTYDDSDE